VPIRAVCACGKVYVFKDKVAGLKAKCPACGGVVDIPTERRKSWTGRIVVAAVVVGLLVALGFAYHFGYLGGHSPTVVPSAAVSTVPRPDPAGPAATVVAIVKGEDPAATVPQALALVGGLGPIIKDGQTVVIKPNLVTPEKAGQPGLMTDVRVVEAVVKEIQKTATCRIIIAEGCAAKDGKTTMDAFAQNGYADLARRYSLELKDLNADQRRTVRIPGLMGRPEYQMPETIMRCDVLIDMPVMKTHTLATVTLGIKNLFGLMTVPKMEFHGPTLDQTLVDIVRMRPPDLVVVDGLTGTEGNGPLHGTPVRMDLVLAGRNVLAVDSVAAAVMGFDPKSINHLAIAEANGVGTNDLARITVVGSPIDQVRREFVKPQRETP